MKKKIVIMAAALCLTGSGLYALTADEIVKKLEKNIVYKTSIAEGRIIINDRFGSRTSTYVSYAEGSEKSVVEFTNREDAGQKILRLENEIYLYYPDAEETIRLQGAALKQSVLGSDFSYEDMTGDRSILDLYDVVLDGEEQVDGSDCYILQLTAKSRDVPYQKETMWVDKELFIYRKVQKLAKSGKILKEMRVQEFEKIDGLVVPTKMIMEDKLKRNSSTEFYLDSIKLNVQLPKDIFSIGSLW